MVTGYFQPARIRQILPSALKYPLPGRQYRQTGCSPPWENIPAQRFNKKSSLIFTKTLPTRRQFVHDFGK